MTPKSLRNRTSDAIINHLADPEESDEYLKGRMDIMRDRNRFDMTSLQYLKYKLGAQSYCVDLSHRNWVWERELYRIYCSKRGFILELIVDEEDQYAPLGDPLETWQSLVDELLS